MDLDPGVHAHDHASHVNTGRRWLDITLGVSALAISLFSAIMTLQHGRAMEQMVDQNARMVQASTWPYVTVTDSNGDERGDRLYRVALTNNGVGPAKIMALDITYKNQRMADVFDLASHVARDAGDPVRPAVMSSDTGGVIPARQSVSILTVQRPTSSVALINAFSGPARSKINVRACYCSLFEDCWQVSSSGRGPPSPVKTCNPPPRRS